MKYVKEFSRRGGRVIVGSDAGSLQALYGFSTIRELELLQEAGFHPIDIIKMATTNATQTLGIQGLDGIRIGNIADLAVVDGKKEHRGGVRWTIKAGIVFDAPALLKEVEWYVSQPRTRTTTNQEE